MNILACVSVSDCLFSYELKYSCIKFTSDTLVNNFLTISAFVAERWNKKIK